MALIPSPPDYLEILTSKYIQTKDQAKGSGFFTPSQPIQDLIQRATHEEYLYWDRFKYLSMPPETDHEEAWARMKMVRATNKKPTRLSDKEGNPFTFWLPDFALKALNDIDRWSGQVLGADLPDGLPHRERYIISSLMEEAIASSQLEGAATTHRVAKDMLRTGRKPRNIGEKMILNNWNTIQYIRQHKAAPLTPDRLKNIHALMTEGTLDHPQEAGRFRTTDDIVVEYNQEVVHVPPRSTLLPNRIEALCDFFNQDDEHRWIHPVVKGILIHFWLAYDHPFTDGNGRTARALFYWYVLNRGYWLFEYLSISRYFVRAPGQYVRAYLYTEQDEGDLTYFLAFNLRVVRLAFKDLQGYLARKQSEVAAYSALLRTYRGLNLRQKALLYHALRHPDSTYSIRGHMNNHQVVYQTARQDLLSLWKRGFLRKEHQGREFIFIPSSRAFEELNQKAVNKSAPS